MEINGAFELLQDLPPIEQLAESIEELSEMAESDFQQLLEQQCIREDEFLAEFDKELQVIGKALPLDVESSPQLDSSELPLTLFSTEFLNETSSEKALDPAQPETEDPVFIMTNLLLQLPSTPIKIDLPSFNIEPSPGNLLDFEPSITLNQGISGRDNIQQTSQLVENNLPELSNATEQSFSLLAPSIEASIDASQIEHSDFRKNNPLLFAESTTDSEESPSSFLEFSAQSPKSMPLTEDGASVQLSERIGLRLETNNESELSEMDLQEQDLFNAQPLNHKENIKETMVIPNKNMKTEEFANLFEEKLTDKITLLVNRNENVAQIQIDPPELGKIDITIEQSDDKTHIKFFTQVEQTKQLIENTVDKLRMHLAQSGIDLGQVDVSAGNQNQRQYAQTFQAVTSSYADASHNDGDLNTTQVAASDNSQLLDLYI